MSGHRASLRRLAATGLVVTGVAACGTATTGTVAQQASHAISSVAAQAQSKLATITSESNGTPTTATAVPAAATVTSSGSSGDTTRTRDTTTETQTRTKTVSHSETRTETKTQDQDQDRGRGSRQHDQHQQQPPGQEGDGDQFERRDPGMGVGPHRSWGHRGHPAHRHRVARAPPAPAARPVDGRRSRHADSATTRLRWRARDLGIIRRHEQTMSVAGTIQAPRTQTAGLFGRVMGLVALTVACATVGVWVARDWHGSGWFVAWLASLGCLIGLNVANSRGRGGVALLLLLAFGLLSASASPARSAITRRPTRPLCARRLRPRRCRWRGWGRSGTPCARTCPSCTDWRSGCCWPCSAAGDRAVRPHPGGVPAGRSSGWSCSGSTRLWTSTGCAAPAPRKRSPWPRGSSSTSSTSSCCSCALFSRN